MLKIFIFLGLAFSLISCAEMGDDYVLESGEMVKCWGVKQENCGLSLNRCTNGREYRCQVNVEKR